MDRAVALAIVMGLGALASCKRWGEGAPDHLVSAEQSAAATPRGWKGAGYAPDPPLGMLAQLFEAAGPVSRKITIAGEALIVCRAAIINGTIDLPLLGKTSTRWGHNIELRVGSMPPKQGSYGAHEGESFVGAPLARLSPGESITLKLGERGLLPGKQPSDTLILPFTGSMPIVAHAEYGDAECRAVDRDVIEKRLPEALSLADGMLRAGRVSADLAHADFGLEIARGLRKGQLEALAIPAGLVGWADPRLALRLAPERLGAFEQQAAPLIQRAFATAAPSSDWVTVRKLRFRRATATCGPAECLARVEIENLAGTAYELDADDHFWLACEDGRVVPMRADFIANRDPADPPVTIPTQQTRPLVLDARDLHERPDTATRPKLLTYERWRDPKGPVGIPEATLRVE